jgi:hypothetical protein
MPENDTTKASPDPSNKQTEIKFKYMKSNFFRVIHADGAWGGVSPRGDIHMSFYNERGALPDSSTLTVSADSSEQSPEVAQSSGAIIREIECDVVLDLGTALSLSKWLDEKIKDLQTLIKTLQEENEKQKKQSSENHSISSRTG